MTHPSAVLSRVPTVGHLQRPSTEIESQARHHRAKCCVATMNTPHEALKELGWSDWFAQHLESDAAGTVARVAAVDREQWLMIDQAGTFRAKLSGRFLHQHRLAHELPCVGDWVVVEKQPGSDFGIVQTVLERRTRLRRKSAGSVAETQMIASNIDSVVIVQSCHFDFNLKRLERYLVMVAESGAQPRILLTKTDLVSAEVLSGQLAEIRAARIAAPVLTLSRVTRQGVDELKQWLQPQRTYCLVGSSGVGKSTLINELIGREMLEIGGVSASGEGRHTTVRRELIVLEGGALVIDNPGMREFGILGAESGIDAGFADISALASECRYKDCSHATEPGCAVREALAAGDIDEEHYENFVKLRKESEFVQMSYAEKRKKERSFGKFMKSAKKDIDRD